MTGREKGLRFAAGMLGIAIAIGGCALAADSRTGTPAKGVTGDVEPSASGVEEEEAAGAEWTNASDKNAGPVRSTILTTPIGSIPIKYRVVGDEAIAEGDMIIGGSEIRSATSVGRHWPNKVIPYVIDANLPLTNRVTEAIAHWEAKTSMRFVPRTNEPDYVHFRSGSGCSSSIGQTGGRQFVNLMTFEGSSSVQSVAIDRSVNPQRVHWFYKRGYATAGSLTKANAISSHYRYFTALGKSVANIVDTAFDSNGHLFAWYDDGSVSEGSRTDFGLYSQSKPYLLAPGKTPADVGGFAIDASDNVYAYYKDGTYSIGTITDLVATRAPRPFKPADGKTPADLAHVEFDSIGNLFAFYREMNPGVDGGPPTVKSLQNSSGTEEELAKNSGATLGRTTFMGHCPTGATIHEIGHAVGLFHEQTRHDRDQFVRIIWENINPDDVFNFEKHSTVVGTDTGPYDFGSIMHYGPTAFTANGKVTIEPAHPEDFDGGTFHEQRSSLSELDLAGVRAMYPD